MPNKYVKTTIYIVYLASYTSIKLGYVYSGIEKLMYIRLVNDQLDISLIFNI